MQNVGYCSNGDDEHKSINNLKMSTLSYVESNCVTFMYKKEHIWSIARRPIYNITQKHVYIHENNFWACMMGV